MSDEMARQMVQLCKCSEIRGHSEARKCIEQVRDKPEIDIF
jgi:hypothetical protein